MVLFEPGPEQGAGEEAFAVLPDDVGLDALRSSLPLLQLQNAPPPGQSVGLRVSPSALSWPPANCPVAAARRSGRRPNFN